MFMQQMNHSNDFKRQDSDKNYEVHNLKYLILETLKLEILNKKTNSLGNSRKRQMKKCSRDYYYVQKCVP